jgi:succinyl-CoA synthetase alpha subunit
MAILIDRETRVLIQGITGRSGLLQTKVMKQYGTKVVAGVTPGKGGAEVEGVPVYDFVAEAQMNHAIEAVISFVPAPYYRGNSRS